MIIFQSRFSGLIAAADSGLSSGRRFRAGWAGNWAFAHVGDAHHVFADGGNNRFGRVSVESVRITSYGAVDEQQLRSLESWLEVALETSARVDQQQDNGEGDCGPRYEAEMGQDTLHAHVAEASAQLEREVEAEERFGMALKEAKVMWDLFHRLLHISINTQ